MFVQVQTKKNNWMGDWEGMERGAKLKKTKKQTKKTAEQIQKMAERRGGTLGAWGGKKKDGNWISLRLGRGEQEGKKKKKKGEIQAQVQIF